MKKISNNVKFLLKNTVVIQDNVEIKDNAVIYPSVYIGNNVHIGKNVTIQTGTIIKDNVYISDNCFIGGGSIIGNNVFLNEFVSIGANCILTHSNIGKLTTISHKCFIGDAIIDENVFIGCGVITSNLNKKKYNKTIIKKNTTIGTNCTLIPPISIGENCNIEICSVINKNIDDNKNFETNYIETISDNK